MNNIYITGSNGFVGSNLKKHLINCNKKVIGVSRLQDDLSETIDYYNFYNQLKIGESSIIHLAGKAHDVKKNSDENSFFEANYNLTKEIFDAFIDSNANTFIYVSSVKAVKDIVNGVLYEDEEPNPITAYGRSKNKAENYILSKKKTEGKRVFIIRPCMIHGAGNKGNLNLLYGIVKKNIPYPLASFENKRSFLSIDNFNYLILNILDNSSVDSGIYNFADDEVLSTNELIKIISLEINQKLILLKVPKKIIFLLSRVGDFCKFPLNSESLNKLTENYVVSNQKIKLALGIKKLPITARDGLKKTINSFIN